MTHTRQLHRHRVTAAPARLTLDAGAVDVETHVIIVKVAAASTVDGALYGSVLNVWVRTYPTCAVRFDADGLGVLAHCCFLNRARCG